VKIMINNKPKSTESDLDDWDTQRPHRGKGWFGDSARHAEAGRKGGKARSRAMKGNS